MEIEIVQGLIDLTKWLSTCFGVGFIFTIALLNVLRGLGFENKKLKVLLCWIYLTLFVFGLCILLEVFA